MSSPATDTRAAGPREPSRDARQRSPLKAAPVPRRPARAWWLGLVLAVLVTVLGLLAVLEGAALLGWIPESPVATPLLGEEAHLLRDVATAVLGVAAALVGLWLLWSALKRGRARGVTLGTTTGVWMTRSDLSRLAAGTAEEVDGVLSADATYSGRKVTVRAETTAPSVADAVRDAVGRRVAALERAPKVVVDATPRHEEAGR